MRVNRGNLLEALARVEPGRSKTSFIAQSSCFVFAAGGVATFNDEICCRTGTELDPAFEGAIPGDALKRALENLSDDEVNFEPTAAGNEVRITGKRKRVGVRLEREILLRVDEVLPPDRWSPLPDPEGFKAAVTKCCQVAGTEDKDFLATCVHLTATHLEATDLRQIYRYAVPVPLTRDFLVRARSLLPAAGFGFVKIGETDNWVHLRNKQLVYSVRRHLDEYLPLDGPLSFRGAPTTLPKGAVEAARLGGIFSGEDKDNDKVAVSVGNGRMTVRAQGANGWAECDLDVSYHGEPIEFRVAPSVLEELVREHNECEIGPGRLIVRADRWSFFSRLGRPDAAPGTPAAPAADEAEPVTADVGAEVPADEPAPWE